jgi:hypothetical protein
MFCKILAWDDDFIVDAFEKPQVLNMTGPGFTRRDVNGRRKSG